MKRRWAKLGVDTQPPLFPDSCFEDSRYARGEHLGPVGPPLKRNEFYVGEYYCATPDCIGRTFEVTVRLTRLADKLPDEKRQANCFYCGLPLRFLGLRSAEDYRRDFPNSRDITEIVVPDSSK